MGARLLGAILPGSLTWQLVALRCWEYGKSKNGYLDCACVNPVASQCLYKTSAPRLCCLALKPDGLSQYASGHLQNVPLQARRCWAPGTVVLLSGNDLRTWTRWAEWRMSAGCFQSQDQQVISGLAICRIPDRRDDMT